ncbi:MAG: hypothetical protein HY811_02545 [Planctomycetes bacterium]|nr:hypothetical protein [Planctomycetota bacterium]
MEKEIYRAEEITNKERAIIYGIIRKDGTVSTRYSSEPIFPAKLAEELRQNDDLKRKCPIDENGNVKVNEIDKKEITRLMIDNKEQVFSRLCSERSEDLVTFTVFESLNIIHGRDENNTPFDITPLLGGQKVRYRNKVRLWFGANGDTLFWRPLDDKDIPPDKYNPALLDTIKKIEIHPREIGGHIQRTESDAVHVNSDKKTMVFLDAKLTAQSSPCYSAEQKACRLYVKCSRSDGGHQKENHCDYWGSDNFAEKDLIPKYFNSIKKPENISGEVDNQIAFCNKYYQLMRNWLFGNILVDTVDAFKGWDFHLVHVGDINHLQDMEFYLGFKKHLKEIDIEGQPSRTFALTTWQHIASSVGQTFPADEKALSLLGWLSNHPVTGSIYGQHNCLFR